MENMEIELSYFAGIVDGEGTIGITKCKKPITDNKRGYAYRSFFSIANTNHSLLNYLKSKYGGGLYLQKKINKSICFQLTFTANETRDNLKKLIPYLKIKKQRAEIVLEFLDFMEKNSFRKISEETNSIYSYFHEKVKSIDSRNSFYHSAGA